MSSFWRISLRRPELLLLVIPLGLAFYFIYAGLLWNFFVSFTNWAGLKPSYGLVGLSNYARVFGNGVFWASIKNNLLLFLSVPLCLGLGLVLATLLDQTMRGESVFRNLYLLPFALSFVATGTMWRWMYAPQGGILNSLFGSGGFPWNTAPNTFILSVIIVLMWQFVGYTTLILIAGMKSVPELQIQAAKLDGASGFRLYRKVVYPQLKGPILTAFVILMMFVIRASFDLVWVLGPGVQGGYYAYTMPVMMYNQAFMNNEFACGAAIASILLALVIVIVIPYLYKTYRR